jgi:hypothetical protein
VAFGTASRRLIGAGAQRIAQRRIYRDIFEIALVAIAFLLYFLVRGSVVDREDEALSHALRLIEIEHKTGLFWEPTLNDWVADKKAIAQFFNQVYFWLDFPLIVAIGLWMYFSGHRHAYTVARDALLASGAIALFVYHFFPLMPPRLMAEHGYAFVDTLKVYSSASYQADSTAPFVNPYAAMPSLHYGWAVLVGGVLFWTTRNVWVRGFALLMPVGQFLSIVFSANHFVLDAFGGLGAGVLGLLIAMALQRWGYSAIRSGAERLLPAEGGQ